MQPKFLNVLDPDESVCEEWRDVVGYEGIFQVSNFGRIKRISVRSSHSSRFVGRFRKPQKHNDGYLQIDLSRGHHQLIHKIVMDAFVGPCPSGYEVNHIDHDRQNNCLRNLEYVTPKENVNKSLVLGVALLNKARGEKQGLAKLTTEQVVNIRRIFNENKISYRALGKMFNVNGRAIQAIVLRETWKHVE